MSSLILQGLGSPTLVAQGLGAASAPALPADFLPALVAYWASDATLLTVSPRLYTSPPPARKGYPFCVLAAVGSTPGGGVYSGFWTDHRLRFAVYSDDLDEACGLADPTMARRLDALLANPLRFASGYQMGFYRAPGATLMTLPGLSAAAGPVFQRSLVYTLRVGTARATQ